RAARALIDDARRDVAALVGAAPAGVTFTGSGSEANVTVLTPHWSADGRPLSYEHLVVSAVEHPSVMRGGRFAGESVIVTPVDGSGVVDLAELERTLQALGAPALVSVMVANNETGVVQPVAEIARLVRRFGGLFHTDAVQAVGRIEVDLAHLGADVITLSAHKLGGPRGAGAVIRAAGAPVFAPLITGGGQESRRRAGTEDVAAIAGFGAVAKVSAPDAERVVVWRGMIDAIRRTIGNQAVIFGAEAEILPQTLCFGLSGRSAETLVIALDLAGVAVSSGAACSSGKVGPSHVLAAMGVPASQARAAIRVSLGWESEKKDIDIFAQAWRNVISQRSR
ncbi:MAG: cysteine desulfurase family protein, partial [Alphaproteobacteria bacterium]